MGLRRWEGSAGTRHMAGGRGCLATPDPEPLERAWLYRRTSHSCHRRRSSRSIDEALQASLLDLLDIQRRLDIDVVANFWKFIVRYEKA